MSAQSSTAGGTLDLVHGPVPGTLIRFSLPFMLGTLLQTLYSTVDTVVVGQYLGSVGLSGVANGSQLMQIVYMLCIGFSNAGQVVLAQAKGAKSQSKIAHVIGSLFFLIVGVSVVLSLVCILFAGNFVSLLNTPAASAAAARDYVLICGAGLIFTGLYNMLSAILRGVGDSIHPLIFILIASVINIVLDILFIAVFDWGVAGTAAATVIGQAVSVVFGFVYLSRHPEQTGFRFSVRSLRFSVPDAWEMTKLGIPMAVQTCAIQFSFLVVSHLFNNLGVATSAAFGVVQKLRNIPGVLTQGLSLGCCSMLGQNLGAKRMDRVRSIMNVGFLVSTAVNAAFSLVFLLAPTLCFRMFTQDETVLVFAQMCVFTLLLEMPGKCVMPPCNALVSAQGFASFSMVIGIIDAFVGRIFLCWLFGTRLALSTFGYFLGYTLSTYLTAVPVFLYYATGLWKRRKLLKVS